ncbi:MAG: SGNH/GDSL hydrolase family protein [Cytophagales bacterium]
MNIKKFTSLVALIISFLTMNAQQKSYSLLFLGDSYTIGEGVSTEKNYPTQLVNALKKEGFAIDKHKIVAKTGWTTGELMQTLLEDDDVNKYDLVFLCVGVNNQYRGLDLSIYKKELNTLINYSLVFASNSSKNVILLSIPDYGFTPFGAAKKEAISKDIDIYNAAKKELALQSNCQFVDITPISRNTDISMVTNDQLHPSAAQYQKWVNAILPIAISEMNSK